MRAGARRARLGGRRAARHARRDLRRRAHFALPCGVVISPPSELELTWQRVGIDPRALTLREDGTIACPQPEPAAREVALPKLRGPSSTEEIAVDGLLGEGGMGSYPNLANRRLRSASCSWVRW